MVTDRRPTENLNPLAAEFRQFGVLTGLLYDPLGYETQSGRVEPWLAEEERMRSLLVDALEHLEAPQSQYERLGLVD